MDAKQFQLEEIKAYYRNGHITIDAKHDKERNGHGVNFISRSRTHSVPDNVDLNKLIGLLSFDGSLTIQAPFVKHGEKINTNVEKIIPIKMK